MNSVMMSLLFWANQMKYALAVPICLVLLLAWGAAAM